jgi:putative tryptophan/tyrosine transport system substrate-binding protein
MLLSTSPNIAAPYIAAFGAGLRAGGYADDSEIELLVRFADGYLDLLPALPRDLVARQPGVIVTGTTATTLAVAEVSPAIPIVCAALLDPVKTRLPEQVTGVQSTIRGLGAKQLELLCELVPEIKRIGHLTDAAGAALHEELAASARARSVTIVPMEVRTPADLCLHSRPWRASVSAPFSRLGGRWS